MSRRKRSGETYIKYYYEKLALLNHCKIFANDALSCSVGGIDNIIVKTEANSTNFDTTESLYVYLASLDGMDGGPSQKELSAKTGSRRGH